MHLCFRCFSYVHMRLLSWPSVMEMAGDSWNWKVIDWFESCPQFYISALPGKLCLQIPRLQQCVLLRNNSTSDRFGPWGSCHERYLWVQFYTLCSSGYPGRNLFVFTDLLWYHLRCHCFHFDPVLKVTLNACDCSLHVSVTLSPPVCVCVLDWVVLVVCVDLCCWILVMCVFVKLTALLLGYKVCVCLCVSWVVLELVYCNKYCTNLMYLSQVFFFLLETDRGREQQEHWDRPKQQ